MSKNISASDNFNSLKVFNLEGKYFFIDSNGNINSLTNSILLNSDGKTELNALESLKLSSRNGVVELISTANNVNIKASDKSNVYVKSNGEIALTTTNTIDLTATNINFNCSNINVNLIQDADGNIVNNANSYTINSNDIFLVAADDIIISSGLSSSIDTDALDANLHKIQIGLDSGLKLANDNIILGVDNNLSFNKKFHISLDGNNVSDILNIEDGIYKNGLYVSSDKGSSIWVDPEISIRKTINLGGSNRLFNDISLGVSDNYNYLKINGVNSTNTMINDIKVGCINRDGNYNIGFVERESNLNVNNYESSITNNLSSLNYDNSTNDICYRSVNIDDKYKLLLWVDKTSTSVSTNYKIYVKEQNKDGKDNQLSLFTTHLADITYASDESPINPNPNIVYFENGGIKVGCIVWTQKVASINYGTYTKFFYKLNDYSDWIIVNNYSGNTEILLSEIHNIVEGTSPDLCYLEDTNTLIYSWIKRSGNGYGNRIVFRPLVINSIQTISSTISYSLLNINDVPMQWNTNAVSNSFNQYSPKLKSFKVTALGVRKELFIIVWNQQFEQSWTYTSLEYSPMNIHFKVYELNNSNISNIYPNNNLNNIVQYSYNGILKSLAEVGHSGFKFDINIDSLDRINIFWMILLTPKYSKYSSLFSNSQNVFITNLNETKTGQIIENSDTNQNLTIQSNNTFISGEIINFTDNSVPYIQKINTITNLGNNTYRITLVSDLYNINGISYSINYGNNSIAVNNYISKVNSSNIYLDRNNIDNYSINLVDLYQTSNDMVLNNIDNNSIGVIWNFKNSDLVNFYARYQFLNYSYTKLDSEYLVSDSSLNGLDILKLSSINMGNKVVVSFLVSNSTNIFSIRGIKLDHPEMSVITAGYISKLNNGDLNVESNLSFSKNRMKVLGKDPVMSIINNNIGNSLINFYENGNELGKISVSDTDIQIMVANGGNYNGSIPTKFNNLGITDLRMVGNTQTINMFKLVLSLGDNNISSSNFSVNNTVTLDYLVSVLKLGDTLLINNSSSSLLEIDRSIIITNIIGNIIYFSPNISSNDLVGELDITVRPSIFSALDNNRDVALNLTYNKFLGINNFFPKSILDMNSTDPFITFTSNSVSQANSFSGGFNFSTEENSVVRNILSVKYSGGADITSNQQLDYMWLNELGNMDINMRQRDSGVIMGNVDLNDSPSSILHLKGLATNIKYKPSLKIQNTEYNSNSDNLFKHFTSNLTFWNASTELSRISSGMDTNSENNSSGINAEGKIDFWTNDSSGVLSKQVTLNSSGVLETKPLIINKSDIPTSTVTDSVELYTDDHAVNSVFSSLFMKWGSSLSSPHTTGYMIPGIYVSSNSQTITNLNEAIPGMMRLYTGDSGNEARLQICVRLAQDNTPIWKTITLT